MAKTKNYSARGDVTLSGVTFSIPATSLEEAKQLARMGQYNDYNVGLAEVVDWDIYADSVELDQ